MPVSGLSSDAYLLTRNRICLKMVGFRPNRHLGIGAKISIIAVEW